MKRSVHILLFTSFLLVLTGSVQAQTGAGAPEYVGDFAALSPADGQYTALEREPATVVKHLRALGFGGAEAHAEIPGIASPVRFKVGQVIEFVVRIASQDENPLNYIRFYTLVKNQDRRVLPLADVGAMALNTSSTVQSQAVSFTATKMGTNFFVLAPSQPLAPGEYMWDRFGTRLGFCFGVDP